MYTANKLFWFTGVVFLCMTLTAYAQTTAPESSPDDLYDFSSQFVPRTFVPDHITKKPGHYTITDWDEAIDETWGWGLPKAEKLQIFDTFWEQVDEEFACFGGLPGYYPAFWSDLRDLYRSEIENGDPTYGVSKGRFAGMLYHISLRLRESHTSASSDLVSRETALLPGVPLMYFGAWRENGHFGAGLTPLPDSSLLVYKSVDDHPLGLVPGDIVLGYDGIPWKDLYRELLDAQLPLTGGWWGSCPTSFEHSMLMAAGMNWHLFDIIDIVKYTSGDTLHLSVEPLVGQNMELWCTEQLDIPGVPMPDVGADQYTSFGIIEGTQIGYIYVVAWRASVESELYDAVNTLMNDYETTGLIIDFRTHTGGWMGFANKALELLFNTKQPLYVWDERCSPNDHLSMCPKDFYHFRFINGSANSYYDKPIAVLVGPGAVSGGDFISLAMKSHPTARFFGKPTAGAFNNSRSSYYGNTDWLIRVNFTNTYLSEAPGNYLTRRELEIDEEVWLTPDDVAQGNDTVVESAVAWINSQQSTQPDVAHEPTAIDISLEYGEVATQDLTVANNGTWQLLYSLTPVINSGLRLYTGDEHRASVSKPATQSIEYMTKDIYRSRATDNSQSPPIIAGHAGPDDFGHVWLDSHQPHGPSFSWVDISDVGTSVNLGNDTYTGPIGIGFDFPFYANSYSELYICSNGILTFEIGSAEYANGNIPESELPNNFIAPWWDDLDPSAGGDIYYHCDSGNERFIVSFVEIPRNNHNESSTFEVILYPNGEMEFNYLNMDSRPIGDTYAATVGIENSDGTDGLEIYYMAPYTIDSYSILIDSDWPAVSPSSSYIPPGENEVANVIISAKNLFPGNYDGNIYLESNDPDEPSIIIPVSLEVLGTCGDYVVGDYNGSGAFNVADIVDGYSRLKTGLPEPAYECECPYGSGNEWAVAMDVNNSCAFNVADIVDGYSKLKTGLPELEPCEECPPPGWEPAPPDTQRQPFK